MKLLLSFQRILILSICFLLSLASNAQQEVTENELAENFYVGKSYATFDNRAEGRVYRHFFQDDWAQGKFIFSDTSFSHDDYSLKLDLLSNQLFISVNNSIYGVPQSLLGFTLNYKNAEDAPVTTTFYLLKYKGKLKPFELKVQGEYSFFIQHKAEKIKSNYIKGLEKGNFDERVSVKNKYFYHYKGELIRIPKRQKKFTKLFFKNKTAIKYLNDNKVNLKNKDDLTTFFIFLNSK